MKRALAHAIHMGLIGCLVVPVLAGLIALPAHAARPADRNPDFTFIPPTPEQMQQGMAAWMEMGQLSIYHQRLAYFVGTWETTTKMWMGGPGGPAQESRGTATYRWLIEGRWVAEDFGGDMMGMPMQGFSLLGYDNFRREYVGIWVDNMGTSLSTMSGRLDQSGKVFTLYGLMDEPMTGEVGKQAAYITRIVDENTHVFEIHDLAIGGDQTKVIEVTYRRKP